MKIRAFSKIYGNGQLVLKNILNIVSLIETQYETTMSYDHHFLEWLKLKTTDNKNLARMWKNQNFHMQLGI